MNEDEYQPITEDEALMLIVEYTLLNPYLTKNGFIKRNKNIVTIEEAMDLLREYLPELKEQGVIR